MKEFKVNDYISLRLESSKTIIYIKGKIFNQCKRLLLNIPVDKISTFEKIQSVDEASEELIKENSSNEIKLSPDLEFWGHCSNLQIWAENDYDTRLLHRNLAFPLLKELVKVGDLKAKRVFNEEIAKRIEIGYFPVLEYLILEGYPSYLNNDQIFLLFDILIAKKN